MVNNNLQLDKNDDMDTHSDVYIFVCKSQFDMNRLYMVSKEHAIICPLQNYTIKWNMEPVKIFGNNFQSFFHFPSGVEIQDLPRIQKVWLSNSHYDKL